LRVVFSQTKKCTVIAFSDANMYATSITQHNLCFKSDGSGSSGLTP